MKKIPIRQIAAPPREQPAAGRFTIRRLEDIVGDNGLVQALHRHDFYFLLAIKKGRGNHEIDFTPYEVVDNLVFFLRPGQVHQLNLAAGCTGYLLEFDTGFYFPENTIANQPFRRASSKQYCPFEEARFDKLLALLTTIHDEYRGREEGYSDAIKLNLGIFFIEFLRQSSGQNGQVSPGQSYNQQRFEEFLELLEKNIADHKVLGFYADRMNLSSYQLNMVTKSTVGKTASELISGQIMLEAKRYLLATPNQVKDIAYQLGYEDNSYFIRFFKKHSGLTPVAFRNNFK